MNRKVFALLAVVALVASAGVADGKKKKKAAAADKEAVLTGE